MTESDLSDFDPEAFEAFFRAHYTSLVRSLSLGWGPEPASDAVQEAFIRAHRHWSRVRGLDQPAAWVRRVAVNLMLDDRRRTKVAVRHSSSSGHERVDAADPAQSVIDGLPTAVADAVLALPERQRLVVGLHYLLDLPIAEVAHLVGISEGTVKSTLHDARRGIGRRLEVTTDD